MSHRLLLLLGLVLCGIAHAETSPRIDLSVTSAWAGWTRPGRTTEVDIRLTTDTATRATVAVEAGPLSVHAEVDLQPGRVVRMQVPVGAVERVAVSAGSAAGPMARREIGIAKSESPLLGVGLAAGDRAQLDGFHSVALAADDLPRHASAYSSIDALIVDARTLTALDDRQLGALLAHAAACGRIVVLNTGDRVRRVLDGAGGCGGRALMSAESLADAKQMLESSLATNLPPAISLAGIAGLARPGDLDWRHVAVGLAVYFAAAALAVVLLASWLALVLLPALASVVALALLHGMQPASQLVIWSEGDSGAQFARYQARQQFPGTVRDRMRVTLPPQLAGSVRSCDPALALRLEFDAARGRATFAEFDSRLFRRTSMCYSGSFPMNRAIAIEARGDGQRDVRNRGSMAWPAGALLAEGLVHDLPALGPGVRTGLGAHAGRPPQDAVQRTAMARTQAGGAAALWALDLGGVADLPVGSKGWLLVSAAVR